MRPMEIRPECYFCLQRLVEQTVAQATADPDLRRQAAVAARQIIKREFSPQAIPAAIANRFHRVIRDITGNDDPFAARKAAETAFLARLSREVAPRFAPDLVSLLTLAVLGNAVDFFREPAEVSREMEGRPALAASALGAFETELGRSPGVLLYLADNAGEEFFDLPLVAHLRRRDWQVYYVVKGGPVQNDLTRQDLLASGLAAPLTPVLDTGARTVGLHLDEVSPAFRQHYDAAGLIVAKGMGHFETMSHLADPRLFFLLQAKCGPVARALGVEKSAFVFNRAPALTGAKKPVPPLSPREKILINTKETIAASGEMPMPTQEIKVKGMSCSHCVAAMTKAMQSLAGVSNVQVDLASGRVSYETTEPVPREDLARVVKAAGFELE